VWFSFALAFPVRTHTASKHSGWTWGSSEFSWALKRDGRGRARPELLGVIIILA